MNRIIFWLLSLGLIVANTSFGGLMKALKAIALLGIFMILFPWEHPYLEVCENVQVQDFRC